MPWDSTLIEALKPTNEIVKDAVNKAFDKLKEIAKEATDATKEFGKSVGDSAHAVVETTENIAKDILQDAYKSTPTPIDDVLVAAADAMTDQIIDALHSTADSVLNFEGDALKEFENDAIDIARFMVLGELTRGTGVSSTLSDNLKEQNEYTEEGWQAHHIVPQAMKSGIKGSFAQISRGILNDYDIDLDDPINGVFLPVSQGDPSGRSGHGSGHTQSNVIALTMDLLKAHKAGLGENGIRSVLNKYAGEYKTGARK